MTTLNTEIRVQSKAGVSLFRSSLAAWWGIADVFDPKVLYDPLAGRFVFTAMANDGVPSSAVLIAVSDTSNPASPADWERYAVDADPLNSSWADFPSIGFDGTRVVVSTNMFTNGLNFFDGVRMFVFDKAELYDGDGVAAVTTLDDPDGFLGGFTMAPVLTHDAGVSTSYLVEDWDPFLGLLRVSTITGAAPNEVLAVGTAFPQVSADWEWRGNPSTGADFAPQLGTADDIQTNDARIGNCVYRQGSIWCTHTVFLPASSPTRSAVQWYEFNPVGGQVGQFGRIDDPSGTVFYAFPSLAVNKTGDVLIGYSRFGAGQYASGNYAYRICGDPPGTMRDDTVLKAGEGPYVKRFGGTRNRWGDYSHTVVDPSDDTTMWTVQEYAAPPVGFPGPDSGRWGTWWGRVPTPAVTRTPPTNPSPSSASHPPGSWRADSTVDVGWGGAASNCGVDGFSFSFSAGPTDAPDTAKDAEETAASAASPALGNGPAYFHLRTVDRSGTWSDPIHAGPFLIDVVAPTDPSVASSTHRVGVGSTIKVVSVTWPAASDAQSGVDGFSFGWDSSPTALPDDIKDAEESATGTTSPPLPPGSHWFHLRTRDNAGNWTSTVHLGPFVITRPRVVVAPRCVVPNVKGKTVAKAKAALKARRCAAGKIKRAFSRKVKKGRVIAQGKRVGSRHPRNTKVGLTVSKGAKKK